MKKRESKKNEIIISSDEIAEEAVYKSEVEQNIEDMNKLFQDENHQKVLEDGSWFTKVLYKALNDNENINAEYFKKKYVGLDTDNIARRIIRAASIKTAITGAAAATAVTASELAIIRSKGVSIATVGATMMGEFATITYLQIKMVHELSILYNAELDKDDPEDLLTIFWFTLGINKWEEVSNLVTKVSNRSAEYLGRKALRQFKVTKLLRGGAKKIGGVQLAKKITEKGILKLVVPGVNILFAAGLNKLFTDHLGRQAIDLFKNRAVILSQLDRISDVDREYQLLTIPLIYFAGIQGVKGNSKVIEMQNISLRHLSTTEEEDSFINQHILISSGEFNEILSGIKNKKVRTAFAEIAILSVNLSKSKNSPNLNDILLNLNTSEFNI